jgi:hypothetical protein
VIPGNDDAIRSGTLMCRIISDAVKEGRFIAERRGTAKPQAPAALTPEQEADKARQQAEARNEAARQAAEREARLAAARTAPPAPDGFDAPGPVDEADALVPSQGSPVVAMTRAAGMGEEPHVEVESSDVVEPNPGAIPAADDAGAPPPDAAVHPGSADHVPVGSHGGQGLPEEAKVEALVAQVDPEVATEGTASPDVPAAANPEPGAFGDEPQTEQ